MTALSATESMPAPRPMRMPRHLLARLFLLLLAAAVLAPLVSLATFTLAGESELWRHLWTYVVPHSTVVTAILLSGVAALTATIGIGTAWTVTAYEFRGRATLCWLLPLPLAFPTYIVAYVYADLFDAAGPVQSAFRTVFGYAIAADYWFPQIRSLPGAILVLGLVVYPYVYLAARAMFQTQSASLIEVARTLGASRFMLLRHVALPLARPALAVGLSLALLETLNDIGASEYLGVQTLTLSIFTTWINRSSLPGAAQIACALLLIVIALMALERYGRRHRRFIISLRRQRYVPRIPLKGRAAAFAFWLCLIPVLLGFVLPFAFLAWEVAARGLVTGFDPDLVRHTLTTIFLAASATAIAIAIGLAAALVVRILRDRFATSALLIAGLGYAIPGTVLALGLLSPLVGIDNLLNAASGFVGGPQLGLVLAGSSAALIIAYVIRFLAIATGSAQAGLARIAPEIDDVARTLGSKPPRIALGIHIPLMRPALAGAALLVFVDCLKELPATLLLRPLNIETLSTYIYQFATRGNFEEGALAALIIVAAGILPVIYLTRFSEIAPAPVTSEPRP